MLLLLALSAHAATTMVLPEGEDPADWQAAAALAGLSIGATTDAPHVILTTTQLCAVLPPDQRRCVPQSPPRTPAEREEVVWLARALLREAQAPPPTVTVLAPATAPTVPPIAAVPAAPAGDTAVAPQPPERPGVSVALSPMLRWRSDSGLAAGGSLSVILPGTGDVQPMLGIGGFAPDRLDLDGPARQIAHVGLLAGARWLGAGPAAGLDVGLDWMRWRQEGEPVASFLLPQVTARIGWRIDDAAPLVWQPWLGCAATLRRVTMSIDGDSIDDPARLSGLVGLSVERSGG